MKYTFLQTLNRFLKRSKDPKVIARCLFLSLSQILLHRSDLNSNAQRHIHEDCHGICFAEYLALTGFIIELRFQGIYTSVINIIYINIEKKKIK